MRWQKPKKSSPEFTKLDNDGQRIFVFGSNKTGHHGAGAAAQAARFWGARYGVGHGRTGQAYAIPTKNEFLRPLPLYMIHEYVKQFRQYAQEHPELIFLVTSIGCGLAGHSVWDIAPMFRRAPENCILPDEFRRIIQRYYFPVGKRIRN